MEIIIIIEKLQQIYFYVQYNVQQTKNNINTEAKEYN